jgi:alpha-tubulin suppressor-like RCC1 family protein
MAGRAWSQQHARVAERGAVTRMASGQLVTHWLWWCGGAVWGGVGARAQVVRVAVGKKRTLVVTADGAVYHWGRVFGRAIDDNHSVRPRMFLWEDINWAPARVPLPVLVKDVVCGPAHAALITADGHLWTFGSNKVGSGRCMSLCDSLSRLRGAVDRWASSA